MVVRHMPKLALPDISVGGGVPGPGTGISGQKAVDLVSNLLESVGRRGLTTGEGRQAGEDHEGIY